MDGVILAVRDADAAAKTFGALFGAERDGDPAQRGARRRCHVARLGTDLIVLRRPDGRRTRSPTTSINGAKASSASSSRRKMSAAVLERVESKGVSVTDDETVSCSSIRRGHSAC